MNICYKYMFQLYLFEGLITKHIKFTNYIWVSGHKTFKVKYKETFDA